MLSLVESTCMIKARDGSKKQDIASHLLPATAREKREAREGAMKLTRDTISALALPADKADYTEWDDDLPGFGVRMRGGSKKWDCQYRINGKQRRESLGDVRKVGIEDAKKIARQRFAQVELGTDPAAARALARAQALTLGVVINRYLRSSRVDYGQTPSRPLSAILPRTGGRCTIAPSTPSSGRTWRHGCRNSSKAHGRTSAARARDNLSALYRMGDERGAVRSQPGHGDQ